MKLVKVFIIVIVLCVLTKVVEAGVILNSATYKASAPNIETSDNRPIFPLNEQYACSGDNGYTSNFVNWYLDGSQTVFSFDFQHGAWYSELLRGASYREIGFDFTSTVTEPFTFSGYYNAGEVWHVATAEVDISFSDVTANSSILFQNNQSVTLNPGNTYLTVPGTIGDSPYLLGGPSGKVIAGHEYMLTFYFGIAPIGTNSLASAIGNLTLKVGTVPEPNISLYLSILVLFAFQKRRRLNCVANRSVAA